MDKAVLQAAQAAAETLERAVDDELAALDEPSELEAIRARRLAEMKRGAAERHNAIARGHGRAHEVTSEPDFFDAARGEDRVLLVFWRGVSGGGRGPASGEVVLAAAQRFARAHVGVKVILVEGEKAPFLTDKMKIWMLPSVVLLLKGKADRVFHGLSDLSHQGSRLTPASLEQALFDCHFVSETPIADNAADANRDDDD